MAAAFTLFSEEAAFLSNNISSSLTTVPNRSSSNSIEAEEANRLVTKALFELNESLVDDKHRVKDELNILVSYWTLSCVFGGKVGENMAEREEDGWR